MDRVDLIAWAVTIAFIGWVARGAYRTAAAVKRPVVLTISLDSNEVARSIARNVGRG